MKRMVEKVTVNILITWRRGLSIQRRNAFVRGRQISNVKTRLGLVLNVFISTLKLKKFHLHYLLETQEKFQK